MSLIMALLSVTNATGLSMTLFLRSVRPHNSSGIGIFPVLFFKEASLIFCINSETEDP